MLTCPGCGMLYNMAPNDCPAGAVSFKCLRCGTSVPLYDSPSSAPRKQAGHAAASTSLPFVARRMIFALLIFVITFAVLNSMRQTAQAPIAATAHQPTRGSADVSALIQNAIRLKKEKRLDDAVQVLQKAVAQAPDNADAHYALAWTLVAKGDTRRAISHFEKVIALAPDATMGQDASRALKRMGKQPAQPALSQMAPQPSNPLSVPQQKTVANLLTNDPAFGAVLGLTAGPFISLLAGALVLVIGWVIAESTGSAHGRFVAAAVTACLLVLLCLASLNLLLTGPNADAKFGGLGLLIGSLLISYRGLRTIPKWLELYSYRCDHCGKTSVISSADLLPLSGVEKALCVKEHLNFINMAKVICGSCGGIAIIDKARHLRRMGDAVKAQRLTARATGTVVAAANPQRLTATATGSERRKTPSYKEPKRIRPEEAVQHGFLFFNYIIQGIRIDGIVTNPEGFVHEVYKCDSLEKAMQFLQGIPEHAIPPLHYVVVKTPEGTIGKDIRGIYNEEDYDEQGPVPGGLQPRVIKIEEVEPGVFKMED